MSESAAEAVNGDTRGAFFSRMYIILGTAGVLETVPACSSPRVIWRVFRVCSRHIIRRYFSRESYCDMFFGLVALLDRASPGRLVRPDPLFWAGFPTMPNEPDSDN